MNELSGVCNPCGGQVRCRRVLVGRYEGKNHLNVFWRRWEDNIKVDLQVVGWGSTDWIDLAHDTDRWQTCECCNEPSSSIEGKFFDYLRKCQLLKNDFDLRSLLFIELGLSSKKLHIISQHISIQTSTCLKYCYSLYIFTTIIILSLVEKHSC